MFRQMLSMDIFPQEIIIEDTTAPAFRIFMDTIYGLKSMQQSLKEKSVDEIFSVLYLVKKYNIPELVQALKDVLTSYPLTTDTVLKVAFDARVYISSFREEAHQLLLNCARFLKNKLRRAEDVFQLIAENGEMVDVIHELAVLVMEHFRVPTITIQGVVYKVVRRDEVLRR